MRHYCTHCGKKAEESKMIQYEYRLLKRTAWHCMDCVKSTAHVEMATEVKQEKIFVELFSGSGQVSAAARAAGFSTVTVDIVKKYQPDVCIDIENLRKSQLPQNPFALWASIPCTVFSTLNNHNHFEKVSIGYRQYHYKPITKDARKALRLVNKTIQIIKKIRPTYFFIENPRGTLRHLEQMKFAPYRRTVSYADYGMSYYKPTDIFTNCPHFKPKKLRGMGDTEYTKRVTDLTTAHERSMIPEQLILEVIQCLK